MIIKKIFLIRIVLYNYNQIHTLFFQYSNITQIEYFAWVSKNSVRYRSKNNIVGLE